MRSTDQKVIQRTGNTSTVRLPDGLPARPYAVKLRELPLPGGGGGHARGIVGMKGGLRNIHYFHSLIHPFHVHANPFQVCQGNDDQSVRVCHIEGRPIDSEARLAMLPCHKRQLSTMASERRPKQRTQCSTPGDKLIPRMPGPHPCCLRSFFVVQQSVGRIQQFHCILVRQVNPP